MKGAITLLSLIFILGFNIANAATVSAVNSHSCQKLRGTEKQFILILKKGENLSDAIIQCANDAKLSGASLTGLGALENPTLNYFNVSTSKYQDKTFSGIFELISLNGTISQSKGKRVVHMHVALGDDQYHVLGGHLSNALIGALAEITVTPFKGPMIKKMDDQIGLELISSS